jgi:chemotaxis protein methyltransferase CheR
METELNKKQFNKVSQLVYRLSGIKLGVGKEALVKARLVKRLRALGMGSFDEYLNHIENDEGGRELSRLIDVITTNKTGFFREIEHFNYLRENILPELKKPRIRFWSAACSSGEEPFSLAILLRNEVPNIDSRDVKILATDISTTMLEKASDPVFREEDLQDLPVSVLKKYFALMRKEWPRTYRIKDNIRAMVKFAWLNLLGPWPMKRPFNIIFCRNVMIYFDKPTQQRLIKRFWHLLEPGGYLFVGHAEGLSSISHKFRYVRPATYRK